MQTSASEMVRLTSLKEISLSVQPKGMIWIIGHLKVEKDQLYITDGRLKYKLFLQLEAQGSKLVNKCTISLGTSQVFNDCIIVSKLIYLNISNIDSLYDFYLPSGLIHQEVSLENRMLDQGTFVVEIQAKSEILCKGSMDFIIQATIRTSDFSWLPANLSHQAQKCCVCTVFIIFHGEQDDFVKLLFFHSFLQVGEAYIFGNLKSSKIRFPNGEKKKILSYNAVNSWFELYDGQLLEEDVVDMNFQMELSFPVQKSNTVIKTKMISYTGVITKVLDGNFRFFEIDGKHQLFLGYCHDQSLPLVSVGTAITFNHAHIFTISNIVVFVGCHFTNIIIKKTERVNDCEEMLRRKVLLKYPTIRDFFVSRNLKTALNIILGDKSHNLSSVIQDIKNSIVGSETKVKGKEPNLFDFMNHNTMEECSFVFGHDQLPQILTPSDLLEVVKELDDPNVNPQKGYHFNVFLHTELGLERPFLVGILDSNESGNLRLRDAFGHSISCSINPESRDLLSCKQFRQLALFSDFQIVVEKYGYASLEELTTKIYVRLTLSSAHFWDIFVKRIPFTPFNFAFQLGYIRPIMWDLNPSTKTLTSSTLEGFGWNMDSNKKLLGEPFKMWIKVSGFAATLIPFLRKERFYFIFGEPQKLNMVTDICVTINQENYIEESESQDVQLTKCTLTPEMPVITLQTFVLGYQALNFSPGLTEELISIRAVIVSKDILSSEAWESPCRLSAKELSSTWNIGIGFSDRICILHLKDEFSHEEFSVYYDSRKLALQFDILPGVLVQFIRLGLQVSKNRKLYGVVLPSTSIEILSMTSKHSLEISDVDEIPPPLVKLCNLNQFSPACRVLCSIAQIIQISLKRQSRAEYENNQISEICGTAILKLEDGTMEATGHINSSDLIFSILSVDLTQKSILIDAAKRLGEIAYSYDSEREGVHSSHELLSKLSVSTCTPALKILRVKFKYMGTDYRVRTFHSKDDSIQIVCPPTLGVQIEGSEPVDALTFLHQQLQNG